MMVKPSCHIYLEKNGVIRAMPYPVAPPGDRRAFNFCRADRAKNLAASDSTSSIRLKGIPWFFNWNTPNVSHAWPISSVALESSRSITGTNEFSCSSEQAPNDESCQTCESGTAWREAKSTGLICWRSRGRSS